MSVIVYKVQIVVKLNFFLCQFLHHIFVSHFCEMKWRISVPSLGCYCSTHPVRVYVIVIGLSGVQFSE